MIEIGNVQTFKVVRDDKEQAKKPLEEAAEVFGKWQQYKEAIDKYGYDSSLAQVIRTSLVDECADVIQATCNLLAAIGVGNMRPYMLECMLRNKDRNRQYEE